MNPMLFVAACAVVLFVWGLFFFARAFIQNSRYTAAATGTVLTVDEKAGVTFRFEINGAKLIGDTKMMGHKPKYINSYTVLKPGDEVKVVYDPHNPNRFRMDIDRSEYMMGVFCMISVGILLVLTALAAAIPS